MRSTDEYDAALDSVLSYETWCEHRRGKARIMNTANRGRRISIQATAWLVVGASLLVWAAIWASVSAAAAFFGVLV